MPSYISTTLLTIACLLTGYWIGGLLGVRTDLPWAAPWGAFLGLLLAGGMLALDRLLRKIPLRRLLGSCLGLMITLLLARLLMGPLVPLFPIQP